MSFYVLIISTCSSLCACEGNVLSLLKTCFTTVKDSCAKITLMNKRGKHVAMKLYNAVIVVKMIQLEEILWIFFSEMY